MITTIFNRADFEHPADGWYQIEPKGIHPNREAGVDQVIDNEAVSAIVNRFNTDADAGKLPQGHELLIDHEHFKDHPDQETVAYGWLQRLQDRPAGIYGQIRWTATGQAAVDGGNYRFFSTEYDTEDLVSLGGTPPQFRPIRLGGLTLTNMPNNKGATPITNRAAGTRNGVPSAKPSDASRNKAAQRIAQLAVAEQRSSGVSFSQAWERVQNRNVGLTDLARGRTVSTAAKAEAREVLEDAAGFAGKTILRLAQSRKAPGLSANIAYIRNRCPRLARMENRQADWDVLQELEPKAHQAYMDAMAQPRSCAQPESRWNGFFAMLDTLKVEFPDLGYEGCWQMMEELYPATFLKFLLSFDDQEGGDLLAPPPKTEQERYQEKRARIAQAANTEARRYGRNGPSAQQLAQDTVNEALDAL
jgi:phage I-like protein